MMGAFQKAAPIVAIPRSDTVPASLSNIGIAAVVPCYKLYEILFGPELERFRADHP